HRLRVPRDRRRAAFEGPARALDQAQVPAAYDIEADGELGDGYKVETAPATTAVSTATAARPGPIRRFLSSTPGAAVSTATAASGEWQLEQVSEEEWQAAAEAVADA